MHTDKYIIAGPGINLHYEIKDFYLVTYLLESFARLTVKKGLTSFEFQKEDKSWVVSEIHVELLGAPLVWMSEIEVELTFRSSQRIKILCDYNITHKNKTIARATMQWIVIDQKRQRPIAHPKVAQACTEEKHSYFDKFRFPKLAEVCNESTLQQKINASVLDFNNHLSTYHYLRYAYDTLDPEFTKNHYPSVFHAKFEKEVYLHETLKGYANTLKGKSHIQLKQQEQENEHSAFKMYVEWQTRENIPTKKI